MPTSTLTPTQKYAAGALFSLALRRAHIHQGPHQDNPAQFWTDKSRDLLRPIFHFLELDSKSWPGLEGTTVSDPAEDHILTFLRIIAEKDNKSSSERSDQEIALTESVDSMATKLEASYISTEVTEKRRIEYQDRRASEIMHKGSEDTFKTSESVVLTNHKPTAIRKEVSDQSNTICDEKSTSMEVPVDYQRKIPLLFELLSACLAVIPQDSNGSPCSSKGYDARHRTGLRLLATWLDVKWIKMEAMEIMLAFSAMAAIDKEGGHPEENRPDSSTWSQWKHGSIIGAAALTGGTLMAITGGLAAPAIAAGFSALAPTLGTLVPVIGATGFTAVATAAGSVAGSVAVAASFGAAGAGLSGTKMARRIGSIEEFEFKPIGENHNKGHLAVGIFVSGFVFEEEDFIRPWEITNGNIERYALFWESKNLIAVSTAIQDWLTSKLTMELMKHGAMMTVLGTLVSALAWPTALLSVTDFIDSKWAIAVDRSDKAGKLLSDVLSKNLQGNRPVTLLGFSLGARVIFKCLQELSESGDNDGLVERVVLLGAPISVKDEDWEGARKMVAGRFVNVYSTDDWILGVTFRASLLSQGLAGIQAVDVPGIENVDVTHLIDGHSSYLWATEKILQQLELDTYPPVFLCAAYESKEQDISNS